MKHILLSCTDLMAVQFFIEHIRFWTKKGLRVDLICSPVGNRMNDLKNCLGEIDNLRIYTVKLKRNPVSLSNYIGYRQMRTYVKNGRYDLIITNEPVMGVITRLASRNAECKVIYITHGFHFYKGAPLINNFLYYNIEKFAAKYTDMIITINKEDYYAAQKFKLRKNGNVKYIPGIGVDLSKFHTVTDEEKKMIRSSLGIEQDEIAVAVVGELNKNKNQQILIRGLAVSKNTILKLYFMGKGEQKEKLRKLSQNLKVSNRVNFLGYRKDLYKILPGFDIGASASIREGLGINLIEDMACGLPVLASNNRGHRDIVAKNGGILFDLNDIEDLAKKIDQISESETLRRQWGQNNVERCSKFDIAYVKDRLFFIISESIN